MTTPTCTHFVFWPYDSFPYVLGAPAYKDRDYWVTPSYQGRLPVKTIVHVAPLAEGAERNARLQLLREQYREAMRKVGDVYIEHAKAAAPWLARIQPYTPYKPGRAPKKATS